MHRASRAVSLSVIALVALGACKKKPEVAPAPVEQPASAPQPAPPPPAPAQPTCDAACVEARNNAAKGEAIRAATAALTATIYFDLDRSDITDDSRAKLDAKVPVLSQNTAVRIRIAGHTDSRGSDEYNLALGQRRAAAAKRFLTQRGVDEGRIEIASLGEERPVCTESAERCWAQNRRDAFEITVGSIASAPAVPRR